MSLYMIKKIVKYGNSYALRLDRTILALLGLEDGELVKLRIEGEDLIIKAAKNLQPLDLILAESDEMNEILGGSPILEKKASELKKKVKENPDDQKELTDWVSGFEKRENLGMNIKIFFRKTRKYLMYLLHQAH